MPKYDIVARIIRFLFTGPPESIFLNRKTITIAITITNIRIWDDAISATKICASLADFYKFWEFNSCVEIALQLIKRQQNMDFGTLVSTFRLGPYLSTMSFCNSLTYDKAKPRATMFSCYGGINLVKLDKNLFKLVF